jgi:hypothetical protein
MFGLRRTPGGDAGALMMWVPGRDALLDSAGSLVSRK